MSQHLAPTFLAIWSGLCTMLCQVSGGPQIKCYFDMKAMLPSCHTLPPWHFIHRWCRVQHHWICPRDLEVAASYHHKAAICCHSSLCLCGCCDLSHHHLQHHLTFPHAACSCCWHPLPTCSSRPRPRLQRMECQPWERILCRPALTASSTVSTTMAAGCSASFLLGPVNTPVLTSMDTQGSPAQAISLG